MTVRNKETAQIYLGRFSDDILRKTDGGTGLEVAGELNANVFLRVDLEAIKPLARKAMRSRGKQAALQGGAILIIADSTEVAPPKTL